MIRTYATLGRGEIGVGCARGSDGAPMLIFQPLPHAQETGSPVEGPVPSGSIIVEVPTREAWEVLRQIVEHMGGAYDPAVVRWEVGVCVPGGEGAT